MGFRCTETGTKRFSHTKYIYIELENFNMGLLGPYQDVLTPKKIVPGGCNKLKNYSPFGALISDYTLGGQSLPMPFLVIPMTRI